MSANNFLLALMWALSLKQKLSDKHIPCPVSYLSFQNQTSSQGQKVILKMGIVFLWIDIRFFCFYSVKYCFIENKVFVFLTLGVNICSDFIYFRSIILFVTKIIKGHLHSQCNKGQARAQNFFTPISINFVPKVASNCE